MVLSLPQRQNYNSFRKRQRKGERTKDYQTKKLHKIQFG